MLEIKFFLHCMHPAMKRNEAQDLRLFDNFHQASSAIASGEVFLTFLQLTVQQLLANLSKPDPRTFLIYGHF